MNRSKTILTSFLLVGAFGATVVVPSLAGAEDPHTSVDESIETPAVIEIESDASDSSEMPCSVGAVIEVPSFDEGAELGDLLEDMTDCDVFPDDTPVLSDEMVAELNANEERLASTLDAAGIAYDWNIDPDGIRSVVTDADDEAANAIVTEFWVDFFAEVGADVDTTDLEDLGFEIHTGETVADDAAN